jgi:hypothetical protein
MGQQLIGHGVLLETFPIRLILVVNGSRLIALVSL